MGIIIIITVGGSITRRVTRNEDRLGAARTNRIGTRSVKREVKGTGRARSRGVIHGYGGSKENGRKTEVRG